MKEHSPIIPDSEIQSVYNLLELIRDRPGMYVGSASLTSIQVFLGGFKLGVNKCGFELQDYNEFYKFHDFVAQKLGYKESTAGWAQMILGSVVYEDVRLVDFDKLKSLASDTDHSTSLIVFYELLNDFRKRKAVN